MLCQDYIILRRASGGFLTMMQSWLCNACEFKCRVVVRCVWNDVSRSNDEFSRQVASIKAPIINNLTQQRRRKTSIWCQVLQNRTKVLRTKTNRDRYFLAVSQCNPFLSIRQTNLLGLGTIWTSFVPTDFRVLPRILDFKMATEWKKTVFKIDWYFC